MTRVADTSFLITLFDADDPRRGAALRVAGDPAPIEVGPEVLGETLGVTHARGGFRVAAGIWAQLAAMPHVEFVETTDVEAVAAEFHAARGKLSWVDAAVVARCRAAGARPLCYDDDILRALRRRGPVA